MSLSGGPSSSPGSRRSHVDMAATDFNITRIKEIQSKFAKGENLFIPGRCFIREGILTKICRKGPKKRHFFLFDDILVYGTPFKGNLLSNQTILQLSEMGVSANCHYAPSVDMEFESPGEGLSKDLAFQVNHTDKSFHVFATSENDRENWIRNLSTYISRSRNDEDGENPTFSPVWLPDITCNNCMLCNTEFTIIRRKHHCRECGRLVCSTCSSHEINLMSLRTGGHSKDSKEERVCDRCFVLLQSAQRKEKGNSGGRKVVDVNRPPRPSRPPAVVGSRKEPPPKPLPYAAARKSIKVSETVKPRDHEISDESEDSGDSEVEDSDTTRQHKEDRTSSQQPTTGSTAHTTTAVPPQTSDLVEPPSKVEPYPALINPGEENKTESKDAIRQTGEPGSKSVEEKKAIFVDKLIQIKPPPVPAPRKGREDDQEGATVKEPVLSGQEKDSEVSATPPGTSQESSTPVGVSEGGAVRPPPRRKRQSKFVKQTPKESANSRENGTEGTADLDGGHETPTDIVQVEGTTLPTPTPVYKASRPVEEMSRQVDETSRPVDVKEEILGTDDATQKNSTLDCEDSTVPSEQSKEDQESKEDQQSKEDSEREEDPVGTTEDSTPSDHVVQEAGTNHPNSLEKDQPSLVDDQVDLPFPSVQAGDHTTSVQAGDHTTSVQAEDHTTSVQAEDHTTSVQAGDHTTSVQAGDHTAPEKGVLSEDSTCDQVPPPTIVGMEEKDGTSTTQSDKVQEDQKHLILQVDKNSPEASPNTARKKARGRKNKFT